MFRKQVNPRTAAIATLVVLASIQLVYWRLLVYRPPENGRTGGGGGPMAPPPEIAQGRADVLVELFAGNGPGYRDGPAWQAQFSGPAGITAAADGNFLVADSRNHRIRLLNRFGHVTTLAGGGDPGGPGGRSDGP